MSFVSALLLCRMFIIFHDHQHGTILRQSWLATGLMTGFGVLTLNPPSIWNESHNHHHKHNAKLRGASIGSFPVMTVEAWKTASRRERSEYAITRHPLTIAFAWLTVFFYGMTLRSLIHEPREHWDAAAAVVVFISLWVVLGIFAPWALLFTFVVPMLIASALGAYLFYAQHNFPTVDLRDRSEWDYVYAALYSSSFLDTSPVMHWFTGNIGYHHIHHLNARVPFYRLPQVMKAIPELHVAGKTSLRISDIRACLRLKLWDELQGKMVPYPKRERETSALPGV